MFLYLAIKNILKNKKNSVILALFIAVITFLFFIGNSIIGKTDRSIREAYIESLTGDVVIQKSEDVSLSLFGPNMPVIDTYSEIPVLPAYNMVMEIVSAQEGITGITSQVSGISYMDIFSSKESVLLCGVDAGNYFSLFPGIILENGHYLRPGEYGVMITKERAKEIERKDGRRVEPGMPALLTSGSNVGFKIREVPIVGIYSYKNPGPLMNEIVIADAQTVRVLNSIQVAGGNNVELGQDILDVLNTDPDDLFGEIFSLAETTDESFSPEMLRAYLKETGVENNGNVGSGLTAETGGDWNFIIIRLEKGKSAGAFISSINKKLEPYGLKAVNWRTAAGSSAILMLLLQALFNAGVFLVSIAGVIASINIMLISVFRRTREIGTLRVIGASDGYIRSLIMSENLLLAFAAGLIGITGGLVFFSWVNNLGLRINNGLLASLLGSVLHLESLPNVAVFSVVAAVILGFTASLYPIEAAVRIEPMAAVRRG